MGYAMADLQTLDLILFAVGTFAAALVTGVAGFAFGIVAAAVWLYSLPPAQTTALIVAYGLIVQGLSVWKLRRSIKPARLLPFLAGAVIGVPIGVELLRWTSPATLRISVGVVLVLFSLYSLVRPQLAPMTAGKAADGAIGVFNGVIGGATGLAGIALTIWCTLRGWRRDRPRRDRAYYLVHVARVAARRAARYLPTHRGLGIPDDRIVARRNGAGPRRHAAPVRDRIAAAARRNLGRVTALCAPR
jgi:Sulfite exporter TauE/SafE